jgi:hypothetical protein
MAVVAIFDFANGVVGIPPADAREGMLAVVRAPGEITSADNRTE